MNFTNPQLIKSNEKKVTILGKIWAGLNLIALFGDFIMPKGVKDNIPIKARNIIILFLIVLLVYMVGCGVFINVQWIIKATKSVSFSLGDNFYYFGFLVIVFTLLQSFNIKNGLVDFANKKKITLSALDDLVKEKSKVKILNKTLKQHQSFTFLFASMGFISFVWVAWGIIFYDRLLFIILFSIAILFSLILIPIKNLVIVKAMLISEIIVSVIMIAFILINHFYFL